MFSSGVRFSANYVTTSDSDTFVWGFMLESQCYYSSPSLPDSEERQPLITMAGGPARLVASPAPNTPRRITDTGCTSSGPPATVAAAGPGGFRRRTRTGVGSSGCSCSPCTTKKPLH